MEKVKQLLQDFVGVISLGGGAPINAEISQILESADYPVIFIDVSIAQAAVRIGFNKDRPLLLINPRQQWMNLMSERRQFMKNWQPTPSLLIVKNLMR